MNVPRRLCLVLPVATLLVACASTPPQATVQVFTPPVAVPAGATYRFERLPSQAARQGEMEAAADALLARAGLRRDDASPRLAVQLAAAEDPAAAPGWGWGWGGGPTVGIGIGGGGRGGGVGIGVGIPIGGGGVAPGATRVDVQVRDLATGQVVFQSLASGGAGANPAALVHAALRDFPNAAPGTRQVPLAQAAPR